MKNASETTAKPNILFFFTDDQRFDTIHALNNPRIHTPNMDALVAHGVTFTHAHIPCGTSGAVCMPSLAMLHTGRSLFHLDGAGERIPTEHVMMGEHFQTHGYRTFGTGKWHNGTDSYARSFTEGAEIFFGGMSDHWNVPVYHFDPSGEYKETSIRCKDPFHSKETEIVHCDHIHTGVHSSELFCSAACDFLASYKDTAPFFMYISFMAPHDPRTMPKKFLDMYNPNDMPIPPNFTGGHPFNNGSLKERDELLADFPRDPKVVQEHLADYYAMITHLDDQMGRVLGQLKKSGHAENTIIVFAGDNGLALGQHGLFGKQNCYEHSVRVPLIFTGPGIPTQTQSDAYVYLFDIFPTLCDLMGIPTPDTVDGENLIPAMSNAEKRVRSQLFFAFERYQRAIKDREYKLIEYHVQDVFTTQLFHIKQDPYETHNLADNPAYKSKINELRKDLYRISQAWDDPQSFWGNLFWKEYPHTA